MTSRFMVSIGLDDSQFRSGVGRISKDLQTLRNEASKPLPPAPSSSPPPKSAQATPEQAGRIAASQVEVFAETTRSQANPKGKAASDKLDREIEEEKQKQLNALRLAVRADVRAAAQSEGLDKAGIEKAVREADAAFRRGAQQVQQKLPELVRAFSAKGVSESAAKMQAAMLENARALSEMSGITQTYKRALTKAIRELDVATPQPVAATTKKASAESSVPKSEKNVAQANDNLAKAINDEAEQVRKDTRRRQTTPSSTPAAAQTPAIQKPKKLEFDQLGFVKEPEVPANQEARLVRTLDQIFERYTRLTPAQQSAVGGYLGVPKRGKEYDVEEISNAIYSTKGKTAAAAFEKQVNEFFDQVEGGLLAATKTARKRAAKVKVEADTTLAPASEVSARPQTPEASADALVREVRRLFGASAGETPASTAGKIRDALGAGDTRSLNDIGGDGLLKLPAIFKEIDAGSISAVEGLERLKRAMVTDDARVHTIIDDPKVAKTLGSLVNSGGLQLPEGSTLEGRSLKVPVSGVQQVFDSLTQAFRNAPAGEVQDALRAVTEQIFGKKGDRTRAVDRGVGLEGDTTPSQLTGLDELGSGQTTVEAVRRIREQLDKKVLTPIEAVEKALNAFGDLDYLEANAREQLTGIPGARAEIVDDLAPQRQAQKDEQNRRLDALQERLFDARSSGQKEEEARIVKEIGNLQAEAKALDQPLNSEYEKRFQGIGEIFKDLDSGLATYEEAYLRIKGTLGYPTDFLPVAEPDRPQLQDRAQKAKAAAGQSYEDFLKEIEQGVGQPLPADAADRFRNLFNAGVPTGGIIATLKQELGAGPTGEEKKLQDEARQAAKERVEANNDAIDEGAAQGVAEAAAGGKKPPSPPKPPKDTPTPDEEPDETSNEKAKKTAKKAGKKAVEDVTESVAEGAAEAAKEPVQKGKFPAQKGRIADYQQTIPLTPAQERTLRELEASGRPLGAPRVFTKGDDGQALPKPVLAFDKIDELKSLSTGVEGRAKTILDNIVARGYKEIENQIKDAPLGSIQVPTADIKPIGFAQRSILSDEDRAKFRSDLSGRELSFDAAEAKSFAARLRRAADERLEATKSGTRAEKTRAEEIADALLRAADQVDAFAARWSGAARSASGAEANARVVEQQTARAAGEPPPPKPVAKPDAVVANEPTPKPRKAETVRFNLNDRLEAQIAGQAIVRAERERGSELPGRPEVIPRNGDKSEFVVDKGQARRALEEIDKIVRDTKAWGSSSRAAAPAAQGIVNALQKIRQELESQLDGGKTAKRKKKAEEDAARATEKLAAETAAETREVRVKKPPTPPRPGTPYEQVKPEVTRSDGERNIPSLNDALEELNRNRAELAALRKPAPVTKREIAGRTNIRISEADRKALAAIEAAGTPLSGLPSVPSLVPTPRGGRARELSFDTRGREELANELTVLAESKDVQFERATRDALKRIARHLSEVKRTVAEETQSTEQVLREGAAQVSAAAEPPRRVFRALSGAQSKALQELADKGQLESLPGAPQLVASERGTPNRRLEFDQGAENDLASRLSVLANTSDVENGTITFNKRAQNSLRELAAAFREIAKETAKTTESAEGAADAAAGAAGAGGGGGRKPPPKSSTPGPDDEEPKKKNPAEEEKRKEDFNARLEALRDEADQKRRALFSSGTSGEDPAGFVKLAAELQTLSAQINALIQEALARGPQSKDYASAQAAASTFRAEQDATAEQLKLTDPRLAEVYNQTLRQQQANAVVRDLEKKRGLIDPSADPAEGTKIDDALAKARAEATKIREAFNAAVEELLAGDDELANISARRRVARVTGQNAAAQSLEDDPALRDAYDAQVQVRRRQALFEKLRATKGDTDPETLKAAAALATAQREYQAALREVTSATAAHAEAEARVKAALQVQAAQVSELNQNDFKSKLQAFNDAVSKFGKDSSQAKAAEAELDNTFIGAQARRKRSEAATADLLKEEENRRARAAGEPIPNPYGRPSTPFGRALNIIRGRDPEEGFGKFAPRSGGFGTGGGSLRGFFGEGLASSIRYGLPSILLYGGAAKIREIVTEANALQVSFTKLDDQYETLFGAAGAEKARQFKEIILETAQASGQSAVELSEASRQINAAFGVGTNQKLSTSTSAGNATQISGRKLEEEQLQAVSELARITGEPLEQVQDQTRTLGFIFGVDARAIGDAAVQLEKLTSVPVENLIRGISDSATTAKAAGFTFNEFASVFAAVEQRSGARGVAGVADSFNRALPALTKGKDELIAIGQANEKLGEDPLFFKGIAESRASDVLIALARNYDNLTKAQKDSVEQLIGDPRSAKDIIAALQNSKVIDKNTGILDSGVQDGQLRERYEKVMSTLSGRLDQLRQKINTLGIAILQSGLGDVLADAANAAATLVGFIATMAGWFGKLNDLSGGFLANLLAVLAAAKGLTLAIKGYEQLRAAGGVIGLLRQQVGAVTGKEVATNAATTAATQGLFARIASRFGYSGRQNDPAEETARATRRPGFFGPDPVVEAGIENLSRTQRLRQKVGGLFSAEKSSQAIEDAGSKYLLSGVAGVSMAGLIGAAPTAAATVALAFNSIYEDSMDNLRKSFGKKTLADLQSDLTKDPRASNGFLRAASYGLKGVPLVGGFSSFAERNLNAETFSTGVARVKNFFGLDAQTPDEARLQEANKRIADIYGTDNPYNAVSETKRIRDLLAGRLTDNKGARKRLNDAIAGADDRVKDVVSAAGERGSFNEDDIKKFEKLRQDGVEGAFEAIDALLKEAKRDKRSAEELKRIRRNAAKAKKDLVAQQNLDAFLSSNGGKTLEATIAEYGTGESSATEVISAYDRQISDLQRLIADAKKTGADDTAMKQKLAELQQQKMQFFSEYIKQEQQLAQALLTLNPNQSQMGNLLIQLQQQSDLYSTPGLSPTDRRAAVLQELQLLQQIQQQRLNEPGISIDEKIRRANEGTQIPANVRGDIARETALSSINKGRGQIDEITNAYAKATGEDAGKLGLALAQGNESGINEAIKAMEKKVAEDKKAYEDTKKNGKGSTGTTAARQKLEADKQLLEQLKDPDYRNQLKDNSTLLARIAQIYEEFMGADGDAFVSGIIAGYASGGEAAQKAEDGLNKKIAQAIIKLQAAKAAALVTGNRDQVNRAQEALNALLQLRGEGEKAAADAEAQQAATDAETKKQLEIERRNRDLRIANLLKASKKADLDLFKTIVSRDPVKSAELDITSANLDYNTALLQQQYFLANRDIDPEGEQARQAGIDAKQALVAKKQAELAKQEAQRDIVRAYVERQKAIIGLAQAILGKSGSGIDQINLQIQAVNADLAQAIREAADAGGEAERTRAQARVFELRGQLLELESQKRNVLRDLARSTSNITQAMIAATGNTVGVAGEVLRQSRKELDDMLANRQDFSDADINNQRAKVINDAAALRDAQYRKSVDDIDFNLTMERITKGQAVNQLKALRAIYANNEQITREIDLKIHELEKSTSNLQYNIPKLLNFPNLYEVRRLNQLDPNRVGQAGGAIGYQDNREVNITLYVNNGMDETDAQRLLNNALGTTRQGSTSVRRF